MLVQNSASPNGLLPFVDVKRAFFMNNVIKSWKQSTYLFKHHDIKTVNYISIMCNKKNITIELHGSCTKASGTDRCQKFETQYTYCDIDKRDSSTFMIIETLW